MPPVQLHVSTNSSIYSANHHFHRTHLEPPMKLMSRHMLRHQSDAGSCPRTTPVRPSLRDPAASVRGQESDACQAHGLLQQCGRWNTFPYFFRVDPSSRSGVRGVDTAVHAVSCWVRELESSVRVEDFRPVAIPRRVRPRPHAANHFRTPRERTTESPHLGRITRLEMMRSRRPLGLSFSSQGVLT